VLRGFVSIQEGFVGGDPAYSYVYRAILIADGQWSGLKLLWHPPGYPLLLALLSSLFGGLVNAFVIGRGVSLVAYVALTLVADRQLRAWGASASARGFAAFFLALYEGSWIIGTQPLSEGPYLLMVWGAVFLASTRTLDASLSAVLGLLFGLATLTRWEGAVAACGFLVALATLDRPTSASYGLASARAVRLLCFVFPFLIVCGWVLFDSNYLAKVLEAVRSVTTAETTGSGFLDLRRITLSLYHSLTIWLPGVVLLPFLSLATIGWYLGLRSRRTRRGVVIATWVVGAQSALVALSVMHKRTGSFLLPGVAVAGALGFVAMSRLVVPMLGRASPVWWFATILLFSTQLIRVTENLSKAQPAPVASRQGRVLRDSRVAPGRVWAFGAEPEVLAFAHWPVVSTFFEREKEMREACKAEREGAGRFVEQLRTGPWRYLTFSFDPLDSRDSELEAQPYGGFSCVPRRSTLEELIECPECFGLRRLPETSIASDDHPVFEILEDAPRDRGRGL